MKSTALRLLSSLLVTPGVWAGVDRDILDDENPISRDGRSVFNVVRFPNDACATTNGFNGTCYTASECTAQGGTASGTCASSFGVCCLFQISCGDTVSANNSYAIISSYSTSADADPCTYTFCKANTEVCKLRIDFDTMELAQPEGVTLPAAAASITDGANFGHCETDSLTISNPGGANPPTICGYNTGQHMWVPASDQCNQINIDIDTGSTATTRKWQIKVTQYECGNLMAPEQDCLQYHTSATGKIASFNWDTSASTVASTQYHLANQYYDICIRRERNKCSVCFDPVITGTAATAAASYGLSGSGDATTMEAAFGADCLGITTISPTPVADARASGDYLEIVALQPGTGTATSILNANNANSRICGAYFNAAAPPQTTHDTACSYAVPFRVGVHIDAFESFTNPVPTAADMDKFENNGITATGSGYGYSGFYLNYWQNAC